MLDQLLTWVARNAKHIPESVVRGMFHAGADVSWLLHVGSVKQLERNLTRIYLLDHTPEEAKRLARRNSRQAMRNYFQYFAEAMTVGGRSEEQLLSQVRTTGEGIDALIHLVSVQGERKSAPIAMGHQGNWDYAGEWIHGSHGTRVVTVAERLANQELLDTFITIRERLGITVFLTGTPQLTSRLEQELHEPQTIVPLLADRDLSGNGEFVRAFGSVIRVARGPATLAYDLGKPLFVVNMYREKLTGTRSAKARARTGYEMEISGPVDISRYRDLPREEAIAKISQAWVDVWARHVREHPLDWHMLQPVFLEDLDIARLKNVPAWVMKELESSKTR